ncbi:hypothetical protein PIB30_040558 [Stylosanthes scabra]|uniref:Uncharacterized protein n=1 Tax=Stylosanthes scabra TaxID=79078 RepID=A0ABU6VFR9_9FABA|nr:hypothetical protein [Stylosanthes scabra]
MEIQRTRQRQRLRENGINARRTVEENGTLEGRAEIPNYHSLDLTHLSCSHNGAPLPSPSPSPSLSILSLLPTSLADHRRTRLQPTEVSSLAGLPSQLPPLPRPCVTVSARHYITWGRASASSALGSSACASSVRPCLFNSNLSPSSCFCSFSK